MISDATAQKFNDLLHRSLSESYTFQGVACAFRKAGYPGFGVFASWEARERWEIAGKVQDYIEGFGKPVNLPALPAVKVEYASPLEAVAAMHQTDSAILDVITKTTRATMTVGEPLAVHYLNEIAEAQIKQLIEVGGILGRCKKVGGDPVGLAALDMWLLDYFGKKFEY